MLPCFDGEGETQENNEKEEEAEGGRGRGQSRTIRQGILYERGERRLGRLLGGHV